MSHRKVFQLQLGMSIMNISLLRTAVFAAAMFAAPAYADSIGAADATDVTLAGEPADDFKWSPGVNPNGAAGSSGFDGDFGPGAWEKIAKYSGNGPMEYVGTGFEMFTFSFAKDPDGKTGDWSITNTDLINSYTLDLVFAIHAGNASGAWLFDDQAIGAGETLTGEWAIQFLNNGGNIPGFSNLTMFARNLDSIEEIPVPEPTTWATLALGLGMMGMIRRRKQKGSFVH